MKSKYKLIAYSDPGHGWLKVPMTLIQELGIKHDITRYSYISSSGEYAFLEEDLDLSTFMKSCEQAGITIEMECKTTNRQSKIRSYDKYPHEKARFLQATTP